ncbi:hypothetical protein [Ursidibacter arcticus]|uniref:hypothetical protein n=1 Tax=Ursidibacter arcticus TaxID=1524965 RepID=UPI0012F79CF9|nr:hypothetical protein [Ursidibacter arcticus]
MRYEVHSERCREKAIIADIFVCWLNGGITIIERIKEKCTVEERQMETLLDGKHIGVEKNLSSN